MVVLLSFLLGMMLAFPDDSYIVLNYEYGYLKDLRSHAGSSDLLPLV